MTLQSVWNQVQAQLQTTIGENSYRTWIEPLNILEKDGTLVIEAPDDFFKSWIRDHYWETITQTMSDASGGQVTLDLVVNPEMVPPQQTRLKPAGLHVQPETQRSAFLNSRFSFDNFVIGPSNRFAFAACKAVAESPAKSYNPLFLYSPAGLGKTHLMQAVTQEIQARNPSLKCSYLPAETFTNELISAIQHRSTQNFRHKYRNIDVLLLDDIHFIAGKEATQEEFFHTFNALHNNHKQIIISSDRPPKEINNLEDRLRTRFAWGLVADIQPPDFETRVAILKKKLEREPVEVPEDVITFIAEQIKTNIRELEGALIRVVAYSLLEEKPISLDVAKRELREMVQETQNAVTPESILKDISEFFQVSLDALKSKRRTKAIIQPRQIAMYLARNLTHLSLPEIGKAFGGKDHTTILHAVKKVEKDMAADEDLRRLVDRLRTHIKG